MSARGVTVNFGDGGSLEYLNITNLTGSDRFDLINEDFTICGWMNVVAVQSPATEGRGFWLFALEDQGSFLGASLYLENCTTFPGTPLHVRGQTESRVAAHNVFTAGSDVIDAGENWFYALVWDHAAGSWTLYSGIDESGSLASTSIGSLNYTGGAPIEDLAIGADFANNYGCNADITNVKIWKRAFSSPELIAEMQSEDPVITTNIWGHYKLANHTDLTNYSAGVGPTLTAVGTLGDGSMDPVDLQAAVGHGRVFIIS